MTGKKRPRRDRRKFKINYNDMSETKNIGEHFNVRLKEIHDFVTQKKIS